jgi:hypothetical protein
MARAQRISFLPPALAAREVAAKILLEEISPPH